MEQTMYNGEPFRRDPLESLLKRRMFYTPAFEIYKSFDSCKGGTKGLFDYGPPGCGLQGNIVDVWRRHFVLEEDMLEVDSTMLTPAEVFKTSGHEDKFADWMCKDPQTGDYLRADHLVENVLEARLKGDKEARGVQESQEKEADTAKDAKKAKKKVKDIKAVKLDDTKVVLYEELLNKIDNFDGPELATIIKDHDIRNPENNNEVLPPISFNLMFKTTIGPSSASPGYLRPETAQGQFLNFKKLLEFNQGQMPFASASVGKSFRNEISPRSGLLRVREFLMAEVEHFVDPEDKRHARFNEIRDVKLKLLRRDVQLAGKADIVTLSVGQAVAERIIDNQTLGYFLARVQLFLTKLGVDQNKLRYRQHMLNEMAHYAADCWDAELFTSYGWIECVGCADRSAYDLTVHAAKTGEALVVREQRATPLSVEEWQTDIQKKKLGPRFRKEAKGVEEAIEALSQTERESLAPQLKAGQKISIQVNNSPVELDSELLVIEKRTRVENVREYTPNVIEPSFGIGRILYCLLEHIYWYRAADEARGVLSFPPAIAPTKVLIVPLSNQPEFVPLVSRLSRSLRAAGISNKQDASGASIGKRYARNDELGTPYGITVDFDSVKFNTFTLRERDSTKQLRGSEDEILDALKELIAAEGREQSENAWKAVSGRLKAFEGQTGDD